MCGRDESGQLKGDGRVGFLKEASIPLVLQLADAQPFRDGKVPPRPARVADACRDLGSHRGARARQFEIKVKMAEFAMKGEKARPPLPAPSLSGSQTLPPLRSPRPADASCCLCLPPHMPVHFGSLP